MPWIFLLILGLAVGSFLNVVALRYDGETTLGSPKAIGGRSHCIACGATLRWFELIPLVSWILQAGKCRRCGASISFRYPLAELISGAIFVLVPLQVFADTGTNGALFVGLSLFWVIAFEALFLMSLIDIRLGIIPDGLNLFLLILAVFYGIYLGGALGSANHSLFGAYASLLGLQGSLWMNRVAAALIAGLFFGGLIAITKGKGMGMGDLKLAIPLGFLLGWPDVMIAIASAFVIGAVVGLLAIAARRKTMKGALPFGPFLAIGVAFVFFFGFPLVRWYLHV